MLNDYNIIYESFNPAILHFSRMSNGYFEGWYFKVEDSAGENVFAFIPGISKSKHNSHSFVQFFNGSSNSSHYFKYNFNKFRSSKKHFYIEISKNSFSKKECCIALEQDNFKVSGNLIFHDITGLNNSLFQPGAMGPFGYLNFLECNHHILSMNHSISGTLEVNGKTIDMNGGRGYIEKDWGTSFPKKYIWIQSNRFYEKNVSVMLSVATVPFMGSMFEGHISVLRIGKTEYRFATYNLSKCRITHLEKKHCRVELISKKHTLLVEAIKGDDVLLKSPVLGTMSGRIGESLRGTVKILLKDNKGNIIYRGVGENSGVEIEYFDKE